MKVIFKKLASAKGASMIIALVFMMICVFIGGVVLVAASVNSGRLNGRREAQQALLNQRSIASSLATALTHEKNGKPVISLQAVLSGSDGEKTASPYHTSSSATELEVLMEKIFCQCYNKKEKVNFTVKLPKKSGESGTESVSCYAIYKEGNVYVNFEETAELQIMFKGTIGSSQSSIKWTQAQIIKAKS